MSSMKIIVCFLLSIFVGANGITPIWPMSKTLSCGNKPVYLSNDFKLITNGSKYHDDSGILKDGFARIINLVKAGHVVDGSLEGLKVLEGIQVHIQSPNDTLTYGIDESYKLLIPLLGKDPLHAYIEAQTVYGALHALQTFSQLCEINLRRRTIELNHAPCNITDGPRFTYRGLLIDTARHYLPVPVIKSVIDSMSYTKLNVLHWHIVDEQSFPLEIPSYPKLWWGAFSSSERYTMADAKDIVNYAARRGIHVLAELDVPGHSKSWGIGYPQLWPSADCQQPLDVSNETTFQTIDGILSDFSKVFKFKFVHLGGDEVDTSCWKSSPQVQQWLRKNNLNESGAYEYFVLKAQRIAASHGYEVINWEETFNNFGNKLSPGTVVHNWLEGGVAAQVVDAGLRCIVSNQDMWYLDHLDTPWQKFYDNEPYANITDVEKQKLVLGGEVCLWGEHIDASDILRTIWPRAAAAAERLWTPENKLWMWNTTTRLASFRCLLNQRGIAAAPLNAIGGAEPSGPGSCIMQ